MKKIISLIIASAIAIFAFTAVPVSAATITAPCEKGYVDPGKCPDIKNSDLEKTIGQVIRYTLIGVGILATVMLIYGATRVTMSAGNAEIVKEGRRIIMFSLIGLGVALLAGFLVAVVFSAVDEAFLTFRTQLDINSA
jgi:hypothetical protein